MSFPLSNVFVQLSVRLLHPFTQTNPDRIGRSFSTRYFWLRPGLALMFPDDLLCDDNVESSFQSASLPSPPTSQSELVANNLLIFPETSIQVFRHFITSVSLPNGTVELDASGIVSKECYDTWLQSRAASPGNPTKVFQRCLTAHITASDGRQSFSPEEERAILRVIREKKVWPAFQGTNITIGGKGFRALGYHERGYIAETQSSSDNQTLPPSASSSVVNGCPSPALWQPHLEVLGNAADPFITQTISPQFPTLMTHYILSPIGLSLPPSSSNMFTFGQWPSCVITEEIIPDTQVQNCDSLLQSLFLQFVCGGGDIQMIGFHAMGPLKSPTLFDAISALSSLEAKFNNFCGLALDLTAIGRDDFVMAQNQASVGYIGPVARNQPNASYRRLVPDSHLINLARHALYCTRFAPSQVVTFSCKVNLLPGEALLKLMICFLNGVVVIGC